MTSNLGRLHKSWILPVFALLAYGFLGLLLHSFWLRFLLLFNLGNPDPLLLFWQLTYFFGYPNLFGYSLLGVVGVRFGFWCIWLGCRLLLYLLWQVHSGFLETGFLCLPFRFIVRVRA